jgi:flagellar biogenesis protein FliO
MPDLLWITISLLGVLGLIFLSFFGLRMLNRRISTSGGRLRVVDRAVLGRESMILVVSVCGKLILVGVSQQRVEKLSDLDMSEEEYTEAAFANARVLPFSDIISSIGISRKNSGEKKAAKADEAIEKEEEDTQDS